MLFNSLSSYSFYPRFGLARVAGVVNLNRQALACKSKFASLVNFISQIIFSTCISIDKYFEDESYIVSLLAPLIEKGYSYEILYKYQDVIIARYYIDSSPFSKEKCIKEMSDKLYRSGLSDEEVKPSPIIDIELVRMKVSSLASSGSIPSGKKCFSTYQSPLLADHSHEDTLEDIVDLRKISGVDFIDPKRYKVKKYKHNIYVKCPEAEDVKDFIENDDNFIKEFMKLSLDKAYGILAKICFRDNDTKKAQFKMLGQQEILMPFSNSRRKIRTINFV